MPTAIETRIFRLHHEAAVSARIGYLASQQRLAYNHAVDILNRTPDIALLKSPRNPDGLLGQITLWRRHDERADAPYIIHQSGAQQAWLANSLMKQERKARLTRLDSGSTRSSDHRMHRRTLAHRSRKRGSSTLSSLTSPVRLDDSTFTIIGARNVVLRTKKPVPEELDIRSFQIVEIRRTHRGVNGALGERRYTLHLQVAVEYPEPPEAEAIETPEQILGIDDGVKKHIAFSDGEFIHNDESAAIAKERQGRVKASKKKKGSRRQRNTLIQVRRSARKRVANRRRLLYQEVQSQYRKARPKAIAIEDKSVRSLSRSARGIRQAPGTGVSAKSGLNRVLRDAALSERMKVVTSEAKKQGIRIYAVWPQGSSQTCAACGYRHRDNRKSQAEFRCLACGHEANADTNAALVLRNRAHHLNCAIIGRKNVSGAPTGWQVKPSVFHASRETESVYKPIGGSRRRKAAGREAIASGSVTQGRSGTPDQDAQRQLNHVC